MKIGTKVNLKTGEEVTFIEFYKIFIKELFNNDTQENIEVYKKEFLKDLKREINLIRLIKAMEG